MRVGWALYGIQPWSFLGDPSFGFVLSEPFREGPSLNLLPLFQYHESLII